jgi:hypothetical protein
METTQELLHLKSGTVNDHGNARAMMEAARTSETSVDNYFTRQYNPEDKSELHSRRRENLKSHMELQVLFKWSLCLRTVQNFKVMLGQTLNHCM